MNFSKKIGLIAFILPIFCLSQETHHINGVRDKVHIYYAFKNAKVYESYDKLIEDATLLIKDKKVVDVGKNISIPKDAVVYDLKGKVIYPSFIDIDANYGLKKTDIKPKKYVGPQFKSSKQGAYNWNQAIQPEISAVDRFIPNYSQAKDYIKNGFGAVLTHNHDGIIRGTSAFVSLADASPHNVIFKGKAANNYSFSKGSSTQNYPNSLTGAIALIRQTYLDAQWYDKNMGKVEYNISLQAMNDNKNLPNIFEVREKFSAFRAKKIADEFDIKYIIRGSGDEYKRVKEIKKTKMTYIIPLNFPKDYDIKDSYELDNATLSKLKHWELAPFNPRILSEAGVEFAITSNLVKDKKQFLKNLRKSIKKGLSKINALKSLTFTPAKILNMDKVLGSLKKGYWANFFISSKNFFEEDAELYENWIQGKRYIFKDAYKKDIRGKYDFEFDEITIKLDIKGKIHKPLAEIIKINNSDTSKIKVDLISEGSRVVFIFNPDTSTYKNKIRFSGYYTDYGFEGMYDGIHWKAKKLEEIKAIKKEIEKNKDKIPPIYYPNKAYGLESNLKREDILIKNATIWTNEKMGVLKNYDILLKNGKIHQISRNIEAKTNLVIDANGKHVTPGIIDEHSHIALTRGVNEATQSSSAEVRMGDVINSEDINIYRQLAGGVVVSQLLHGSANPIGGQSAIIKMKWGQMPEDIKVKGADKFIKFALGENVKQSNWGDRNVIRFPQTRMGVEQVYYDAFYRAKDYKKKWKKYNSMGYIEKAESISPRRDLDLEAMNEILERRMFITCHSYIQSEINMLMHVADSMGFRVNTFTHILEGYKVAEKMRKHGVGASTFSDWWGYKYEVNEAIPYNAAIMDKKGLVVAINSDDAEMGRRLNQEAAKAIKYGAVSEQDALKMVTLNPAKLLHLDDRMGSIREGKDATIVIWSKNPLSVYSKVTKTIIDGIIYYDIDRDKKIRIRDSKERKRIISQIINKKLNNKTSKNKKEEKTILYRCNTILEDYMN